jgi:hypothetical protein
VSNLAIIAVRAAIRIGKTAADAFDQYAQEKPILIPNATRVRNNVPGMVSQLALDDTDFAGLLGSDPELKKLWANNLPVDAAAADALEAVVYRFRQRGAESRIATGSDEIAYGVLVTQWAHGKGPVSPWVRMVVAMADVALEFVAGNPQVLGVGSNGEKLVGAIADAISAAIPEATERSTLGPRDHFAERLAALVLHAGLKTIAEHPDLVVSEDQLKALLNNTLTPVVKALDTGSVAAQVEWRNVTDALLGPALGAALTTIAHDPTAFLGRRFNTERAAGVMVTGLLKAAADTGVRRVLTNEGLRALGHAVIAAAAEHPEVILGDLIDSDLTKDVSPREALALNLFRSIAGALEHRKPPYQNELGVAIAVAAVDGLKQSAPALLRVGGDWNAVIVKATNVVLDGFAAALGDDAAAIHAKALTHATLLDVARVALDGVAQNPRLLVGEKPELGRIVAAIGKAMAADKELLLAPGDWTQIAAVAAQEAAMNPGRLFGINASSMDGELAADIIGRLLQAASNDLRNPGHVAGPVMLGQTLREAVIVTLRAISGNVQHAFAQRESIGALAENISQAVATRGLELGGKEWLGLFRALLPDVLSRGTIPTLDDAKIAALLAH